MFVYFCLLLSILVYLGLFWYTVGMQRWYAVLVCSVGMQRWYAALVCSVGVQRWYAALVCSVGMPASQARVHSFRTKLLPQQIILGNL